MQGPYLRGPLRLEGLRRSPARAPADPPKGSVHSPPQPREDPKDSGLCERGAPQSTAAVENAENHNDDSITHKTSLRPTTTASPWPPQDRANNAQLYCHAVTTYSTALNTQKIHTARSHGATYMLIRFTQDKT